MTLLHALQWLHDSWIGDAARRYPWVFTTGLILHFIGLSLLMGSMLIVDLRILGVGKQLPLASAFAYLRIAVFAFALNLCTGIVFFSFDPLQYWLNPAFRIKLVLLLLAGLNAAWFFVLNRDKTRGRESPAIRPSMRISAAVSLTLWFGVMIFGRLIVAFQGSTDFFK